MGADVREAAVGFLFAVLVLVIQWLQAANVLPELPVGLQPAALTPQVLVAKLSETDAFLEAATLARVIGFDHRLDR